VYSLCYYAPLPWLITSPAVLAHLVRDRRVGHGSGPSTGRLGSGWVGSGPFVWVALDYTKCYAKWVSVIVNFTFSESLVFSV